MTEVNEKKLTDLLFHCSVPTISFGEMKWNFGEIIDKAMTLDPHSINRRDEFQ